MNMETPTTVFEDSVWSDSSDGAPMGSLCEVISLKSQKKAQRVLIKTRRRTDAAAFREHVESLNVPPTTQQTPEAIELAGLLREAKRTNVIRRRHSEAAKMCGRRPR